MSTGKKLGIAALICAVLFVIFCIIQIIEMPEIRDEVYDLMATDYELAEEMMEEDLANASTLYKIADKASTFTGLVGFILAIVSLVKMKGEKGKVFPIIAIILIVVTYIVTIFSVGDMGKAFQAGLNAGMSSVQE